MKKLAKQVGSAKKQTMGTLDSLPVQQMHFDIANQESLLDGIA